MVNTPEMRFQVDESRKFAVGRGGARPARRRTAPTSTAPTARGSTPPTAGGCCAPRTPRTCSSPAPRRRTRPASTGWSPRSTSSSPCPASSAGRRRGTERRCAPSSTPKRLCSRLAWVGGRGRRLHPGRLARRRAAEPSACSPSSCPTSAMIVSRTRRFRAGAHRPLVDPDRRRRDPRAGPRARRLTGFSRQPD